MPKLEYYVLNHDFNTQKVFSFNVFDNWKVRDDVIKITKKYLKEKDKFAYTSYLPKEKTIYGWDAYIKSLLIAFREEWSRVEYEISVGAPFENDCSKLVKTDCYSQIEPNIEMIAREIIYQVTKKNNKVSYR